MVEEDLDLLDRRQVDSSPVLILENQFLLMWVQEVQETKVTYHSELTMDYQVNLPVLYLEPILLSQLEAKEVEEVNSKKIHSWGDGGGGGGGGGGGFPTCIPGSGGIGNGGQNGQSGSCAPNFAGGAGGGDFPGQGGSFELGFSGGGGGAGFGGGNGGSYPNNINGEDGSIASTVGGGGGGGGSGAGNGGRSGNGFVLFEWDE